MLQCVEQVASWGDLAKGDSVRGWIEEGEDVIFAASHQEEEWEAVRPQQPAPPTLPPNPQQLHSAPDVPLITSKIVRHELVSAYAPFTSPLCVCVFVCVCVCVCVSVCVCVCVCVSVCLLVCAFDVCLCPICLCVVVDVIVWECSWYTWEKIGYSLVYHCNTNFQPTLCKLSAAPVTVWFIMIFIVVTPCWLGECLGCLLLSSSLNNLPPLACVVWMFTLCTVQWGPLCPFTSWCRWWNTKGLGWGESQCQQVPIIFGEQSALRQCNSESPSVVVLTTGRRQFGC